MSRNFTCLLQGERSYTQCMIPTLGYFGKGKTMETVKKISGYQGLRGGKDELAKNIGFLGKYKLFYMTLKRWVQFITHLSKSIGCTNTKREPLYQFWTLGNNDVNVSSLIVTNVSL